MVQQCFGFVCLFFGFYTKDLDLNPVSHHSSTTEALKLWAKRSLPQGLCLSLGSEKQVAVSAWVSSKNPLACSDCKSAPQLITHLCYKRSVL